jgi:hypothetical protein
MHRIPATGLLALSTLTSCFAPKVGLEARYGQVDVGGSAAVQTGGISAENSVEALGIQDTTAPSLVGDFKWGSPHLYVNLQRSDHDGTGVLEADLTQGGITIPVGTQVDTRMDLGLYTSYLTFDFLPGDSELGLGVGIVGVDLDFSTTDDLTATTIETSQQLPIPVVAARGGCSVWRVQLDAVGGIMQVSSGDDRVSVIDLDAGGRICVLGDGDRAGGWLTLGYRYTDLDLEYTDGGSDVKTDLDFSGPYVGLRFSF